MWIFDSTHHYPMGDLRSEIMTDLNQDKDKADKLTKEIEEEEITSVVVERLEELTTHVAQQRKTLEGFRQVSTFDCAEAMDFLSKIESQLAILQKEVAEPKWDKCIDSASSYGEALATFFVEKIRTGQVPTEADVRKLAKAAVNSGKSLAISEEARLQYHYGNALLKNHKEKFYKFEIEVAYACLSQKPGAEIQQAVMDNIDPYNLFLYPEVAVFAKEKILIPALAHISSPEARKCFEDELATPNLGIRSWQYCLTASKELQNRDYSEDWTEVIKRLMFNFELLRPLRPLTETQGLNDFSLALLRLPQDQQTLPLDPTQPVPEEIYKKTRFPVLKLLAYQLDLAPEQRSQLIALIEKKSMKEGKRALILVHSLSAILKLTPETRAQLIKNILMDKDIDRVLETLSVVKTLLNNKQESYFETISWDSVKNFHRLICEKAADEVFTKLGLSEDPVLREICLKRSDLLSAFMIYLFNARGHKAEQVIKEGLTQFISCLKEPGSLHKRRYANPEKNVHLKACKKVLGEKRWAQFLSSEREKVGSQEFRVITGDRPEDLHTFLYIGEDVGSCQAFSKESSMFNQCLLGYALNGMNQIVGLYDKDNKAIVRGILRLMLDYWGRPVYQLEPLYGTASDATKLALLEFAKKRADKLGVPLVAHSSLSKLNPKASFPIYRRRLKALSTWKREYVDSVGAVNHIMSAPYVIASGTLVTVPKQPKT